MSVSLSKNITSITETSSDTSHTSLPAARNSGGMATYQFTNAELKAMQSALVFNVNNPNLSQEIIIKQRALYQTICQILAARSR